MTLKPCPICKRPSTKDAAPFCSKRCADVDLHRWLAGAYATPAEDDESLTDGGLEPGSDSLDSPETVPYRRRPGGDGPG